MYQSIIIGAGVSGSAIARSLARYQGRICVVEAMEDVCCSTSKANSAIVHAGFDAKEGSLMAKLNVQGSEQMEQLSKDLDFHYHRNGSLVACMDEADLPNLMALRQRGITNGVKGLEILTREQALALEPNLSDAVVAALSAPTGAIVCPFGMNLAFAEHAHLNGVDFRFNTKVMGFTQTQEGWIVHTNQGDLETQTVVNAAGVYADDLHYMVSKTPLHITPRRGEYLLLDKSVGNHVSHTVFQLPSKLGKGVLVTPTVHGNLLVGPTAEDIADKEGTNTSGVGLAHLVTKGGVSVKNLPLRQVITSFAGLRAHEDTHEFSIGELADAKGFFDCAGIESPGLSAAPAIGDYVAKLVAQAYDLVEKQDYIPTRKAPVEPATMTMEQRQALIAAQPAYGQIVCRCELISEGEIRAAIAAPLGARNVDGVKRRVRAGSGRCQGGFCAPRVMELIAQELGIPMEAVTKNGGNSRYIVGYNKDAFEGENHETH
ncbi:NAD(P)/FAD-dependent oxidoreductase [Bengtsoniella intestinalis]|uniref:NAD(P)/FAD-dependent oxidoreductase n=1 Tax=Bengtsoniella intestinalis TaxID=3073143 RepID=UPI00391F5DEE